jgi:hypothetical protein
MTGGTAEEFEEEFYELLHPIGRYPTFECQEQRVIMPYKFERMVRHRHQISVSQHGGTFVSAYRWGACRSWRYFWMVFAWPMRQTLGWINKNQFYSTPVLKNVNGWERALRGVDFSRKYA